MSRVSERWYSHRMGRDVNVVRWGEVGKPVLFFPTAAADFEECERFHMVDALAPLMEEGLIKLYSVDSVPGMVWLKEDNRPPAATRIQRAYDSFVAEELVPAIRADCRDPGAEVVATGPSIGAFNALSVTCNHPDLFSHAICLSGTYDLSKFIEGEMDSNWYHASPLHFLPGLAEDHEHLRLLRTRFILLAHGTGKWEDPKESWRVAETLGQRGIPNRVDEWGTEWNHDWPVWRNMLPQFLRELLPQEA